MARISVLLALILAGVLVLFGAQNTEPVTLHFLVFTCRSLPLALALLGAAAIGALSSFLVGLPSRFKVSHTGGELKRHNARQQTQIAQLQATAADDRKTQPAR